MWKWHYDKWRGVNFPKMLSLPILVVEKSGTTTTIFSDFCFQFHEFYELMCEYKHLLEQKKFDLDSLCGNGTMTNGGGRPFSQKLELSLHGSTREWISSTFFSDLINFFGGRFIVFSMSLNIYWNKN